ncbi:hypothetical protein H6761_03850 [Candidatus Nomurabacteria bacterium]|nr:hypothetical protein [Candidatus Nomurabacteria bacterium]
MFKKIAFYNAFALINFILYVIYFSAGYKGQALEIYSYVALAIGAVSLGIIFILARNFSLLSFKKKILLIIFNILAYFPFMFFVSHVYDRIVGLESMTSDESGFALLSTYFIITMIAGATTALFNIISIMRNDQIKFLTVVVLVVIPIVFAALYYGYAYLASVIFSQQYTASAFFMIFCVPFISGIIFGFIASFVLTWCISLLVKLGRYVAK